MKLAACGDRRQISGIAERGFQMPAQEAQKETIYGQCVTPVLHSQHLVASKTSGRTYSTPLLGLHVVVGGYEPFVQFPPNLYTRR